LVGFKILKELQGHREPGWAPIPVNFLARLDEIFAALRPIWVRTRI
jgi:hypothetical protein